MQYHMYLYCLIYEEALFIDDYHLMFRSSEYIFILLLHELLQQSVGYRCSARVSKIPGVERTAFLRCPRSFGLWENTFTSFPPLREKCVWV